MVQPSGTPLPGTRYEIVVRGPMAGALLRSFDGLELVRSGPDATHLSGWFPDQPALHALLRELAELGLELCSIRRMSDMR